MGQGFGGSGGMAGFAGPALAPAAMPAMNLWSNFGRGVMVSVFRNDDNFTARHQEGSLIITVNGKVRDGKSQVSKIHVQDGDTGKDYDSADQVPERYRDKVKNLIESGERQATKVEVKDR
jgi:hypothetical protein